MFTTRTTRTARFVATMLALAALSLTLGSAIAEEWNLLDRGGRQTAYVAVDRDFTIYLWNGEPVVYLHDDGHARHYLVYGFDGTHLGWYEGGILWDLSGDGVGFLEGTQDIATVRAGAKGVKRIAPIRRVRAVPRVKPVLSYRWSSTSLTSFLAGAGATPPAASTRDTATSTAQAYTGVGMRHWVRRVEAGGATVILEDGSRWEVQPIDRIHSMLWLPVDDIQVASARSPIGSYRYALTHTRSGRSVLARYLGR